jgi:nicotinate-nucleotide pyrophosphorylase (carboxylating)
VIDADLRRVAAVALGEDLRDGRPDTDVTTMAVVPAELRGTAEVTAKASGVVFGLGGLQAVYEQLGGGIEVDLVRADGDRVEATDVLARLSGCVRTLLTGERVALNILGHLSGIATLTASFVEAAQGVRIVDTRKTLPGLKALQKAAVRAGGGHNHRFALWDGVLVKDNHIVAAGDVGEATRRAKAGSSLPVQVEVATASEARAAIAAGADALLLDNLGPRELADLVVAARAAGPGVLLEASGGVTLYTVESIAASGVDRISVGALTHSAPGLDVSVTLLRAEAGS